MKKTPPVHAKPRYFPIHEGELTAGSKKVSTLKLLAGQTPFYVYDRSVILDKIATFRQYIPSRISLHYAMKANPHPAIVQFVGQHVEGLDVASQKEMLVALNSGVTANEISFAGPAKTELELSSAIAAGIVINIESKTELERIIAIGKATNLMPKIAFRVNPDFELKSSGMKMSGGPKQFGIDAECLPTIISELDHETIDFKGFHIFSGSQNLKPESLIDAHNKTFELAAHLASFSTKKLEKLNIGGGFGIPYFPGEQYLDISSIGENLKQLLAEYETTFNGTEIIIELGRYLVGESGLYVCEVSDKKESRGQTYLMTDGGLHHHLSNSGNFGQVIRKNYPVAIANKMCSGDNSTEKEVVNIVGPLCTPLDIVADKMQLPKAEIGDLVAVYQSGAYGATASPRGFLSHPDVIEIIV